MAREPASDGTLSGMARGSSSAPTETKPQSKSSLLLALLGREEGATLDQMVDATGWQPHTTRAALTGFRKKGLAITSEKLDGVRIYRLAQTVEPV
jgi:hypothetical protein